MNVMPSLSQDSVSRVNALQQELANARLELRQAENARDERRCGASSPARRPPSPRSRPSRRNAPLPSEPAPDRIDAQRTLDELRLRFTEYIRMLHQRVFSEVLEAQREAERKATIARGAGAVSSWCSPTPSSSSCA